MCEVILLEDIMKKAKWLLAVVLIIALATVLVACTDNDGNGQGSQGSQEVPKYTITFDSQGGSSVASCEVKSGDTLVLPAAPTKEGYDFSGWYTEESCTNKFAASQPISQDMTLYAKWEKEKPSYTVEFDTCGGSDILSASVKEGMTVTMPQAPTKDGYLFDGWYLDEELTQVFDETQPITENVTLYAKWKGCLEYTLTEDDSGYVVSGIGTFDDTDIEVLSVYNSKPVLGIAKEAFKDNTALTSVTIGDNVKTIDESAFSGCAVLTAVTFGNDVTDIGTKAFFGCKALSDIVFGDSVANIGESAFHGCSAIVELNFPASIKSMDYRTFSGCPNLNKVNIKDIAKWCEIDVSSADGYPVYIAKGLYVNGQKLTELVIPDTVTEIGDYAFIGCEEVTSLTLSKNLKTIGESAFSELKSLTTVEIPQGVVTIGRGSFGYCSKLASVSIPDSVKTICDYAFQRTDLTSVVIPDGVESIGEGAFTRCSKLENVTIPNSVWKVGSWAFHETKWLKNQPDGMVYAGKVAYTYKGTMPSNTNIALKNDTISIACDAFYNQANLASVTLPEGVKLIGDAAFWYSGIKSIVIPKTLTTISRRTFYGCESLMRIDYSGTTEEWNAIKKGYDWQMLVPKNCQIVCTNGTLTMAEMPIHT